MKQSAQKSGHLTEKPVKCSQSRSIDRKPGQLTEACAERVFAWLVARHPERTAENVAADTRGRVSAESVRNWLRRSSTPSWRAGLALVDAYGPEFLAAAMGRAPGWLDAAARAQKLAALEARHAALAAEIHSLRSAA